MHAKRSVILIIALSLFANGLLSQAGAETTPATTAQKATLPAPQDVLGFVPGDDRKLASWAQVVGYFRELARASDRVKFAELGKSSMGNPFVMATISAPENLARLEEYKTIQNQLADPRKLGAPGVRDRKAAELIRRGKTIVLITCGIHSTEVGSYLSSMLIAHRLASSDEPQIQNILRNTIILLVPSLNPDGVDIVKNWYDKTLGTPYEGTDPPELYHKYTGHDNNRDWYAFTQVETQITVDKIHNVWHPQIVHDIHQQGALGSRLFLPPYMQPVEPNVPKQIVAAYTQLGEFMARQMRVAGFTGITTNSTYDAWSPSRAYSHYHGGVRILSETASCKIATPITVKFGDLRSGLGYDPRKETENFGPLWRGGEWHLRDITNYMTTAAFLLLRHAAENRSEWLSRFYEIGKDAVRPRRGGELKAFILPPEGDQWAVKEILDQGNVESNEVGSFTLNGVNYPNGTEVIRMAQPYGSFAKALLEPQHYPNLRDSTGHPIAPYDVTAHTLPLLMNAQAVPAYKAFKFSKPRRIIYEGGGCAIRSTRRVSLYKSYVPSIDEGWTRWVFENQSYFGNTGVNRALCFPHVSSLTNSRILEGGLSDSFNVIILPDQPPASIINGYKAGTMPPELTGGLGQKGVNALREFVEQGGTLVCLNRASIFAIEQLKLPVRDITDGVSEKEFFVPGSILRIELDTTNPIALGMPKESIAWVEDSPVFDLVKTPTSQGGDRVDPPNVHVIARYPSDRNPLLSGWLLGENRIRGKAALVEVTLGKGRVILFGFRPQYRAQSLATYPLFFNAITIGQR
ncbi:MAG TPA: M14 metallopeptidase family protein [Pyrinomonadaceae bacterium]|nr:M14 metallopeptidase family protein [Pyrinomonadaceae bacterium]